MTTPATVWGQRPNPPLITVAIVAGLALPPAPMELEAVADVPLGDTA